MSAPTYSGTCRSCTEHVRVDAPTSVLIGFTSVPLAPDDLPAVAETVCSHGHGVDVRLDPRPTDKKDTSVPATDLSQASDHPAEILYAEGNKRSGHILDTLDTASGVSGVLRGVTLAATTLRQYERDKGVTFAALDNDALHNLRDAYAGSLDVEPHAHVLASHLTMLQTAVRDLFGLEDA